jgi:hypothetical protein
MAAKHYHVNAKIIVRFPALLAVADEFLFTFFLKCKRKLQTREKNATLASSINVSPDKLPSTFDKKENKKEKYK